jgi:hypothetical protein
VRPGRRKSGTSSSVKSSCARRSGRGTHSGLLAGSSALREGDRSHARARASPTVARALPGQQLHRRGSGGISGSGTWVAFGLV